MLIDIEGFKKENKDLNENLVKNEEKSLDLEKEKLRIEAGPKRIQVVRIITWSRAIYIQKKSTLKITCMKRKYCKKCGKHIKVEEFRLNLYKKITLKSKEKF
jgi:hypothetical protein